MTEYNKAESSNPEKRSKPFTSPANDGGEPYGRTKAIKDEATPTSPLANLEKISKAEADNHNNG